jgi:hypothetical protein
MPQGNDVKLAVNGKLSFPVQGFLRFVSATRQPEPFAATVSKWD